VPETPDWKQKYRDALQEMEEAERRARQVEQSLRRLVGRLCAAGMGVNATLDDELSAVAAANRRNAPADELENLAGSLTTVIVAIDAVAPVLSSAAPAAARWEATRAAVAAVLKSLKEAQPAAELDDLIAQLPLAGGDAELAGIVERSASLIGELGDSVASERIKTAAVLSEVTHRLEEVAQFVAQSGEASRAGFDDTDGLNEGVLSQVREISQQMQFATDLTTLQSMVSERLDTVAKHVQDFRTREDARRHEQARRAAHMSARIEDLEREAQELCRKLNRERHSARIDPLTRLANRKSFDERLAREIAQHGDAPVSMLLLDVDDFKTVNDSYGHRAGDRVLQTVAHCLAGGLRAEDLIARIGGEEFVVLMTGVGREGAMRIANGLRTSVEALKLHFRGTPVRVTVSCGCTELKAGDTSSAVFDRADAALYRAKRGGKNLCVADS
jgi:diguanylate cyclase